MLVQAAVVLDCYLRLLEAISKRLEFPSLTESSITLLGAITF